MRYARWSAIYLLICRRTATAAAAALKQGRRTKSSYSCRCQHWSLPKSLLPVTMFHDRLFCCENLLSPLKHTLPLPLLPPSLFAHRRRSTSDDEQRKQQLEQFWFVVTWSKSRNNACYDFSQRQLWSGEGRKSIRRPQRIANASFWLLYRSTTNVHRWAGRFHVYIIYTCYADWSLEEAFI